MRIDVVTIFPEMFPPVIGTSIMKRAVEKKVVEIHVHDLRDWSSDKHRTVDDRPYGGGPGMVMKVDPFFKAVEQISEEGKKQIRENAAPYIVLLSPQGQRLHQKTAEGLSQLPWLIFLCGHYEGVDERVRVGLAHQEISIGDYVLTCGELPAMVLVDAVVRLLPGSLGDAASSQDESFQGNLLEYPQYTRPEEYRGMRVPDILLSGDQARVAEWRKQQAFERTKIKRSDLFHGSTNSGN